MKRLSTICKQIVPPAPTRKIEKGSMISSSFLPSSKISLFGPPVNSHAFFPGQTASTTSLTNSLLQQNHDKFHVFFNEVPFHNHIVHHLLAIYALGGSESCLKNAYNENVSYQRENETVLKKRIVNDLNTKKYENWEEHLANPENYSCFLTFFQKEIDKEGWKNVVKRWVFGEEGTKLRMMNRLCAGLLHPFIHLGYGVEFEQPGIIAEALAQAAVHPEDPTSPYLDACVRKGSDERKGSHPSFVHLIQSCFEHKVGASAHLVPSIQMSHFTKAREELISIASQWNLPQTLTSEEIAYRAAELVSGAAYLCGGAPRLDKALKFDFFAIHSITSSVFIDVFIRQDFLSSQDKIKILNYLAWTNLAMYVIVGSPALHLDQIKSYVGKEKPFSNPWLGVVGRANKFQDDGHAVKMVRGLMNGEGVTRKYWERKEFLVKDDMWIRLANMCMDSVEDGQHWVQFTGFDDSWKAFGPRK